MPWAADPVFACSGEMAQRMAAHPWHDSVLGVPAGWPQALRTAVSILLRSKYPMLLTWGEDLVMLYNDAFIPTLGEKHPRALGDRLAEQFSEIWEEIRPLQQGVLAGGEATWDQDLPLVIERGRGPEETFFTFSYSAVPDDDRPGGVLAVLSVTTSEVVGARRLALLNDLGSVAGVDVEAVVGELGRVLAGHPTEVPGGRLWLEGPGGPVPAVAFGAAPPLLAAPAPATDLDAAQVRDRVWLAAGSDGPRATLELALPALRPLDDDHRRFLRQLAQQVGQQLDIAHARELEVARARALAELDAAKTEFLSTVSHELRTPLTLLLGPVEAVAAGRREPLGREEAGHLQHQGRRLLGMVEDLLEVARAESGRLVPRPEPVAPGPFTARLVAPLLDAAERAGLAVDQRWQVEAACLLDRRLWENIVVNLVANAVKYTPVGLVAVSLAVEDRDLVLTVRDSGIGIPAEEQPLVFQRFHRVRTAEGRTIEGAGVGLAIVADAVHALGGTVDLVSTPGLGTTVTVRLPGIVLDDPSVRADAPSTGPPADAPTDAPTEDRLVSVAARAEALVPGPGPGVETGPWSSPDRAAGADPAAPVLLVVDDNPGMRAYLAECLEGLGRVVVAKDGLEALELLARWPVGLVVSDVMMPRMDGEELLRRIRQHPDWSDLPVVLLSARAETAAAVSGLAHGADDYLAKPFSRDELLARARAHLELTALRRETQRRRDRDTVLAGVSHDMQTPLAVILGGLGLVDASALAPADADVLRRVRRSGEDLRGLVCEMLDRYALSWGEEVRIRAEPVDLHPLVVDALRAGGPQVHVDVPPGCTVLADALRLRRILVNLLENCARAGARTVRVSARARSGRPEVVELQVVDDGPGIQPAVAEQLFDPWESGAEDGRTRGLGLFVSRASARGMGGDLVLGSTGPRGTTFVLTLLVPGGVSS